MTTLDLIDLDEYYTIFVMAKTERDENESNKTEVHLKPICSDVDTMKNHSMCKSNKRLTISFVDKSSS